MSKLKLLPLGGMGSVTQNMYVYQYENEILVVDCGIGFPDMYMPGVDTLIPDISYLQDQVEKGAKIVAMLLSHGHDDHIGALPYLLGDLPEFPIYASPLTAGFAHDRLLDKKIDREIHVVSDKQIIKLSQFFSFELIAMTHSVPDTKHIVIETPVGKIYHGSDFKLDKSPVDGVLSDMEEIKRVAGEGILLALLDCLRVEEDTWTKSESSVGPALEKEMENVSGKILVTLMSSHIHRIQQVVDSCEKLGRQVVFVGRSVEQNVVSASLLKKLHLPVGIQVDKNHISEVPDSRLCIVIAGSQGQEGSSLVRAVYGEHRIIQITPEDKVIFSANVIPGNEINYYAAIDELSANGVEVVYPDINRNIHSSGHASSVEQREMVDSLSAKYLMPIGGADRHRALFRKLVANAAGYDNRHILLPKSGEVIGIDETGVKVVDEVLLNAKAVDGLGIGDVGPVVLSDRLSLSKAGIIVLVIPKINGNFDLAEMKVVSRGFVFMKEADEVIQFIKEKTAEVIGDEGKNMKDDELKKRIERRLAKKLYKVIQREPMIVPVIVEM
jgi:ribonuclease J